jgi:hypothetical protein
MLTPFGKLRAQCARIGPERRLRAGEPVWDFGNVFVLFAMTRAVISEFRH